MKRKSSKHGVPWWDYVAGEYVTDPPLLTNEEAERFLPQKTAVLGLFAAYRAKGLSIAEAIERTLEVCVR